MEGMNEIPPQPKYGRRTSSSGSNPPPPARSGQLFSSSSLVTRRPRDDSSSTTQKAPGVKRKHDKTVEPLRPSSVNVATSASPGDSKEADAGSSVSGKRTGASTVDDRTASDEVQILTLSPRRRRKMTPPSLLLTDDPGSHHQSIGPTARSRQDSSPALVVKPHARRIGLPRQSHPATGAASRTISIPPLDATTPHSQAGAAFFALQEVSPGIGLAADQKDDAFDQLMRSVDADIKESAEHQAIESGKTDSAAVNEFFEQSALDARLSAPWEIPSDTPDRIIEHTDRPAVLVPLSTPAEVDDYYLESHPKTQVCDFCDQPMPEIRSPYLYELYWQLYYRSVPDPKRSNANHRTLKWSKSAAYCVRHDQERTILPEGKQMGYPELINWNDVPRRLATPWIHQELCEVIRQPSSSASMREAMRLIKQKEGRGGSGLSWLSKETFAETGYYGILGKNLLTTHLMNLLEWRLLPAITPSAIKPLRVHDFVIYVLVPQAANLLIMQDQGCTKRTAKDWADRLEHAEATRHASLQYGACLFPDIGKEAKETMKQYRQTLDSVKDICMTTMTGALPSTKQPTRKQSIIDLTNNDNYEDEYFATVKRDEQSNSRGAVRVRPLVDKKSSVLDKTGQTPVFATPGSDDVDMDFDENTSAVMFLAAAPYDAEESKASSQTATVASAAPTTLVCGTTSYTGSGRRFIKTPSFDEYAGVDDLGDAGWQEAVALTDKASSLASRSTVSAR